MGDRGRYGGREKDRTTMSLCPLLSVRLSFAVSLSPTPVRLLLFLSLPPCSLSFSLPLLSVFLYFSLSHHVFLSLYPPLMSMLLSFSLSLSTNPVCVSIFLSLPPYLSHNSCLCFYLSLFLSLSFTISPPTPVSVSIFFSLSLSPLLSVL